MESNVGTLTYAELDTSVNGMCQELANAGVSRCVRIAVVVSKRLSVVVSLLAVSRLGAVAVPINPALTLAQVEHIVEDCEAVLLIGDLDCSRRLGSTSFGGTAWQSLDCLANMGLEALFSCPIVRTPLHRPNSNAVELAAILYTSGSTGRPKGVMVSHGNMLLGTTSVAQYLESQSTDRVLVLLQMSFDYGFNQLLTSFHSGACAVLYDYILAKDIPRTVVECRITGIAAVPHVWSQLSAVQWPDEARRYLRYITSSGGAMPVDTTKRLRKVLPNTRIHLMYGLTEAFRSTSLSPEEVDARPGSIGKAIPGANLLVINEQSEVCKPYEVGELVHTGDLVSYGYWNNEEATAYRFRSLPPQLCNGQRTVWTGDRVYSDEEGYLFHAGRSDDLIKSHGFRVSPEEIEEVLHESGRIVSAVAFGVADHMAGQRIVVLAVPRMTEDRLTDMVAYCKRKLPTYMTPKEVIAITEMPLNQNGKVNRRLARAQYESTHS